MSLATISQYIRAGAIDRNRRDVRLLTVTMMVAAGISLVVLSPAHHPLTLYPGMYLGTTVLALAVPLLLGRTRLAELAAPTAHLPAGPLTLGAFVVLGMALASMIELASSSP